MYFTHPQLQLSIKNWRRLNQCFLSPKKPQFPAVIKRMFPEKEIYFTDMGRSAFRLIVECLELRDSEMLMPAYICDIFYSLVKAYNIRPVFLDVDKKTFNITPQAIEKAITEKTKSVLVCHTYGKPAQIEKIAEIAKRHNLNLIEDCAHALGLRVPANPLPENSGVHQSFQEGTNTGKYAGNFGDAALFSLYKLFPCLRGGMAIFNQKPSLKKLAYANFLRQSQLPKTKFSVRDFVSLLNCFAPFSFLFKRFAGSVAKKHIRSEKAEEPAGINRVCYNIFYWQVQGLTEIIKKRQELGRFYQLELKKLGFEVQDPAGNIFTYLSALVPKGLDRDGFVIACRKQGVFPIRIWRQPFVLNPRAQEQYHLSPADFPNTTDIASRIINFPLQNFYTEKHIRKILSKIKAVLKKPCRYLTSAGPHLQAKVR